MRRPNTPKWFGPDKAHNRMDKELQVVGFRIGRETFGLPISIVREIVRVPEITSVPNAPDYIEGVINLRGRIIPIVDLRKRFGDTTFEPNKKNRIVVVELETRGIGLIVNSASEVLRIPPSDIEEPHNVFKEGEVSYITGVGKLNGRLVILLDLSRILQPGELEDLEEIRESTTAVPAGRGRRGF
jgi:purine-binding chemotaxis protein CheW